MRYTRSVCLLVLMFGAIGLAGAAVRDEAPVIRIGLVLDGPWERNEDYKALFKTEILTLTEGEFDVRFPEEKTIEADWTPEGVGSAVDSLLDDPQVDLILALGIIVAQDIALRGSLPKPVVVPFVLDAELLGISLNEGASGVKNFSYINIPENIVTDVKSFLRVVPFEKLAYFINQSYLDAVPDLKTRGRNLLKEIGIDFSVIGVGEKSGHALSQLPEDVEAVYIGPLTRTPPEEYERLIRAFLDRELPSFSGFEVADVEKGIMACVVSNIFPHVARRTALNVQRILVGEEPGSIPVNIEIGRQLTINMATARAIHVLPDWSVLTEAELIQEERTDVERRLDLGTAVMEAVEVNLDLAAEQRSLAAGLETIKQARSILLPRIDLSGLGLIIDKDRAEASFGSQAERTLSGSVTATQLIFSEPALANLSIQRSLQKGREWSYEQFRLDIALAASVTYLNVLRAKTFERIQRENVRRTRINLDLARVRESVGTAGPAEVYRWESELATHQQAVIRANAQRNLAEIEMNRLLNRPQEESFATLEKDLRDQVLFTSRREFLEYTRNYRSFKIFRDFMVEEGLRLSPELAELDAALAARRRALTSASHSLWMPTLALQGSYSNTFAKGGTGSGSTPSLPPPLSFPAVDDRIWSLGLSLTFPLFEGGGKFANRLRARKELEQLELQRESAVEKIEQRIRSSLHLTGASFVSIDQANLAAEAAMKSLEVVQNAYEQGAVSIVRLLDAQNAAYNAEQVAADAVFEFLIDLMNMERSISTFEFFMSREEQQSFLERMKAFFEKEGFKDNAP